MLPSQTEKVEARESLMGCKVPPTPCSVDDDCSELEGTSCIARLLKKEGSTKEAKFFCRDPDAMRREGGGNNRGKGKGKGKGNGNGNGNGEGKGKGQRAKGGNKDAAVDVGEEEPERQRREDDGEAGQILLL